MPSNGTEYTVFDFTLPLDTAANITMIAGGKNSYSSTSIGTGWPWYLSLYVDGVLNNYTGGSGAITDSVSLLGAYNALPAGNHDIKLTWSGHSGITFINAVMTVLVTKR